MANSRKRRKFISTVFGSKSRDPKPTPYIESVNALEPKDFWSKYCRDIPIAINPHYDLKSQVHSQVLSELTSSPRKHDTPSSEMFLVFRAAAQLSQLELDVCFNLIAQTSQADYEASSMGWHPAKKRKEMRLPDMKYFLLLAIPGNESSQAAETVKSNSFEGSSGRGNDLREPHDFEIKGFVSLMPTYEDGQRVLYIYEIHLQPSLQGSGLGTVLMNIAESVGKNVGKLEKMMLTVFRSNERARKFYERLEWSVDGSSPEWVELRNGRRRECDYQIWSKSLGTKSPPLPSVEAGKDDLKLNA